MKITFFSNFLNHHQLPFCREMERELGDGFTFVACTKIPDDRIKLGYEDMNKKYPFVLRAYDSEENENQAMKLARESDFIIFGAAPVKYIRDRERTGKPSFIYTERLFKPYISKLMIKTYLASLKGSLFRKKKDVYILCASQYTANDYRMIGAYKGRYFRWGYFPQSYSYDRNELMTKKRAHEKPVILWAGRLIPWKHTEAAIRTASYLKQIGIDYEMRIIGDGSSRREIEAMIMDCGLKDHVHLLGSMSPDNVRKNMEEASVFLFTSDYNEGWGAVLNESMNSGCAVVVSSAVGSAGFLVENGKNGIVYPYGNQEEINYWTALLVRDAEFRENLGWNACQTIQGLWNAQQAAVRLLALCKRIQGKDSLALYNSGPCSPAICYNNHRYLKKAQNDLIRVRETYEEKAAANNAL